MNSFTHISVKTLRSEIETAIKQVADKHNLIIQFDGGARFSPTECTFSKLKAVPKAPPTLQQSFQNSVAANAVTMGNDPYNTLESREYINLAYTYGLKKEWLGRQFKSWQGTIYTIIGLRSRLRKYPVIAIGPQGGRYKFAADVVKKGII